MDSWLLVIGLGLITYGLSVAIRAFYLLWKQNTPKTLKNGSGVLTWDIQARQFPEEAVEGELALKPVPAAPSVILSPNPQKIDRLISIMREVNVDPQKALHHPMSPALVAEYCSGRMGEVEIMRAFRNLLIFNPGLALDQNKSVDTFE